MGDKKTQSVDYYEILETNRDASVEELRKNYQRLALTLHPDKRKQEESESFLLLQKAWSVLRDPIMRKQYDAEFSCQQHSELLIFETISLKDMQFHLDEGIYTYSCRCGGTYILEVTDSMLPTVIMGCDECSFSIKINL